MNTMKIWRLLCSFVVIIGLLAGPVQPFPVKAMPAAADIVDQTKLPERIKLTVVPSEKVGVSPALATLESASTKAPTELKTIPLGQLQKASGVDLRRRTG